MSQLDPQHLFRLQQTRDCVILADIQKKRLIFWNQPAATIYGICETTYSLEDIFVHCSTTLSNMIMELVTSYSEETPVAHFPSLFTIRPDGEEQFADLTISYDNMEKTILCFHLCLREDTRMTVAQEMINNGVKPLFLADLTEDMTIFYANELFYTTFTTGKCAFESYYKNAFAHTMLDIDSGGFFIEIKRELLQKKSYRKDIQISTVHGVKKWFLLELQIIQLGKNDIKILGSLLPIAERIEVANRLEQMHQYLTTIQELTSGALFYLNAKGTKLTHHSILLKRRGLANEMDSYPKCVIPLIHEDDVSNFLKFSDKMVSGNHESFQFRYKTGSNNYSWAKISCLPILDAQGDIVELVGRVKNIDNEVELVKQATIDPLTNALNKEFVKDTVENILSKSLQQPDNKLHHALFFMDLDNFKYVNDNLGHKFGDFLLQELGKRLCASVRSGDIIGRVGGDEFIFLIRNIPNMSMLLDKAQRLLDTIGQEFNDGTMSHYIGGSVGIAVFPEHGTTYDDLYKNADTALYRSKRRGKNMATIYKEETADIL